MRKIIAEKLSSMSLLVRMLIVSTATLSIVVSIIFLLVIRDEAKEAKSRLESTISIALETIPLTINQHVKYKNYEAIRLALNEYLKDKDISRIYFTDESGVKIEASEMTYLQKSYPDIFANMLSINDISAQTMLVVDDKKYGSIEITVSSVHMLNNMWFRLIKGLMSFVLILLLNMLIIWFIMKRRLLPTLRAIEEGAIRLSTMTDDVLHIKEGGAPELRKTLAAFNKMANTIKKDRETIKKTLEIQNAFFENNAAGFLLVSSNRTMLMANKQFYEMFGYAADEVIGKDVRLIHVNEDTYSSWAPRFQTVKEGMDVTNVEYKLKHKDGHIMWCSLFGSKIELANDEKGVLWSMIDITERKLTEDELKQLNTELETKIQNETAARLEQERILMQQSRMAAMGEMIGAIAHQWRQPLNALGIMIQDLRYIERDGELTPEILDNTVNKSMNIIKFMSKTIDDFRGFFKTDKSKKKISVIERVKHSTELLSAQLSSYGITLEINGDDELETTCLANEFEQVILNLVNNARDALVFNNIKEPTIDINIVSIDDKIDILLSDNAGGIPEDIIDKIFDPYFTTKGPDRGTGMGLYMSKIIVENHMGGKLSVKNGKKGAVFLIELPV